MYLSKITMHKMKFINHRFVVVNKIELNIRSLHKFHSEY